MSDNVVFTLHSQWHAACRDLIVLSLWLIKESFIGMGHDMSKNGINIGNYKLLKSWTVMFTKIKTLLCLFPWTGCYFC